MATLESVEALNIFFNFKGDTILDYANIVVLPLEPRLLIMWDRIGEALQVICEVLDAA